MQDTNEDLLSIGTDHQPKLLREAVAGWESGIGEAVALEQALWSLTAEASSLAILSPPDRPEVTVYAGGDSNGKGVEGVGYLDNGIGVVLVTAFAAFPDLGSARLLLVDHDGSVMDEIDVPLDWADATWSTPTRISASGNHVLVNRYAEGTWLEAIVVDLDTGLWEMYAEPGLSRFAATPAS